MSRRSAEPKPVKQGVFAELQVHIDRKKALGEPLVPLHIGDTYLPPPEAARIDAQSVVASDYVYGATDGLSPLREAMARRLETAAPELRVDPQREVLLGTGGTHAFFCAASAVLSEGDEVLVASPYWPLTPGVFSACGVTVREVPLTTEWLLGDDIDLSRAFEAALSPATRAVYFASPNNPDGKVWSRRQLEQLVAFAVKHDLWIFADEVYADLVFEGVHVTAREVLADYTKRPNDRLITIHSLSKSFALAGLRLGYVHAPANVVASARRVGVHTSFNVPTVLQRAGLAALQTGGPWLEQAKATYASHRAEAREALKHAGLRAYTGEGATYFFVDFRDVLRGRPMHVLLERAIAEGVLVTPGEASGSAYAGWARLCFTACPKESLAAGILALSRAANALSMSS